MGDSQREGGREGEERRTKSGASPASPASPEGTRSQYVDFLLFSRARWRKLPSSIVHALEDRRRHIGSGLQLPRLPSIRLEASIIY